MNVDTNIQIKGTDTPKNRGSQKEMDRPKLLRVKKLLNRTIVKAFSPKKFQMFINNLLFLKPVPQSVEWKKDTKEWVIEQLYEDIRLILKYGGKTSDFWDLG